MKQIRTLRISIESLALFLIPSGCLVESNLWIWRLETRFFAGGDSSERLHVIDDHRDPKCCVTGVALQSPRGVWANFKEGAKRLYPLRYWPRERRGNSAQRTAAR